MKVGIEKDDKGTKCDIKLFINRKLSEEDTDPDKSKIETSETEIK